ncbi:MAG: retropepsin-like aspartic protease family protein [Burkholderiales bacterium]
MEQDQNPHRRSGIALLVIAWTLVFGLAFWYFNDWERRQYNPNPQVLLQKQSEELVLKRNREGHYVAEGEINGARVIFLLDTGATQVAIPARLARRLDLRRGQDIVLNTANGRVIGYETRLQSVRVGPIEMHDVSAVATEGMEGDTVLLGMSFLKRLEFTQREDRLILRQPKTMPEG